MTRHLGHRQKPKQCKITVVYPSIRVDDDDDDDESLTGKLILYKAQKKKKKKVFVCCFCTFGLYSQFQII